MQSVLSLEYFNNYQKSKICFLGGSTISRDPTDNLRPWWPGGSLSFVEIYRRTSTQTWGTQWPKKPTYNPCGNQSWTWVWKTHEQSHRRKCRCPCVFDRSFALSLQRIAFKLTKNLIIQFRAEQLHKLLHT